MVASAIDPREWNATIVFLREHELLQRPEIAVLVAGIDPSRPTPATLYQWRDLRTITASFRAFHEEYPQVVAPPGILDGFAFRTRAWQVADRQPITISEERLTQHIAIVAQSGGGKTTFAQHLITEAYDRDLAVIVVDGKSDAQHFATKFSKTIVIAPPTPIALLEIPSWLSPAEANALLERVVKRTWWGGIGLEQVAHESLRRTYEKHQHPSVADWRNETLALHQKGETYGRKDRIDGLAARLTSLTDYLPGIGATPVGSGIPLELLCTNSVYFGYTTPGPVVDLIANWLFESRLAHNRARAIRQLNTIGLIDESHLFLHEDTIAQTATFGATFPLLREFGIGIVLTATNYDIPTIVRANIGTHVVMNISDAHVARDVAQTVGVKDHQQLQRIPRGECIIKTPEWPHAIRAAFEPLTIEKNVGSRAWQDALARTMALGRTAAREERTEQPANPSPASPAASPTKTKIALNAHAEALLKHAATSGVALTTEAFRDLELHPQAGTRAKKQLLDLALIEEERITIRRGRGGTAVAIRPTKSGYERAGAKRHGTRGGDSLQHQWLIHALAKRIPNARIDALAGSKACDVLIPYNAASHQRLATVLGIAPRDGEFIAIEIEVSDPERTASRNVSRNASVGIDHTITATMTPLRQTPPGVVVIDVFELLEAL